MRLRSLLGTASGLLAVVMAGPLAAGTALATATPAAAAGPSAETTIFTAIRWGGPIDKGNPLTVSTTRKRMIVAHGVALMPTIFCNGPNCDPGRPGRIEILRQGAWEPWATGTLAQLADSTKVLTSKRNATFLVRSVLPAHAGFPAVTSSRWSVRFLPGTAVAISGSAIIKATPANDYRWQFRPGPGTVTVALSPAAAGRVVELRDAGVEGYPLLGKGTTNARGRLTITADFTDTAVLAVTVLQTRERAGWYVDAERAG